MSDANQKSEQILPPVVKQLNVIGVKPHEKTHINIIRIFLFLGIIGYIIYMIIDDYNDHQKNQELVLELFKDDEQFYKKLERMDDDLRNAYLKAIKQSLDNTNSKQRKLYDKLKSAAFITVLTEFIISGDHIGSFGGLGSTLMNTSMNVFI
jgi:preprotein translocase subunit Sss1